MRQEQYQNIRDTIEKYKKSKNLSSEMVEIIKKLDKLMDDEYKYGSSYNQLLEITNYLIKCKEITCCCEDISRPIL